MRLNLNQSGDTLVEVLIAMTIVGVILAGGYVSANASAAADRQSQERSIVLGLMQSQLEELKTQTTAEIHAAAPTAITTFCATDQSGVVTLVATGSSGGTGCNFDSTNTNLNNTEPIYHISLTANKLLSGVYLINATTKWARFGST